MAAVKVDQDDMVDEFIGKHDQGLMQNLGYDQTAKPKIEPEKPPEFLSKSAFYG